MKNYKFINLILIMMTIVLTTSCNKAPQSCEDTVKGINSQSFISIDGKDNAQYGCYVTIIVDSKNADATLNSLNTKYKWANKLVVQHPTNGTTIMYLTQFVSR
uniref:Lipoprotein n=1 Tax=Tolypothrix bouteillei VB521301 TaxID=1479485 RepID=A0A0C1N5J6_9CYAN